jgi:16S rRNA (uracil1498-N3)-methyltransferase
MTRRRWIADEFSDNRASLTGEHANHLQRVLRARVGQEFDIVVGPAVRRGQIVSLTDGRVDFDLGEEVPTVSAPNLTLLMAIFKFDRMEWAIEKCTELGVNEIVPVIARRTEVHLASASAKRVERWVRVAAQATEQSRRAAVPKIVAPMKLADAVTLPGALRVVLSESEQELQLRDVLAQNSSSNETLLAVGPEGGWTDDELNLFHRNNWISASLGSTILRAETAAIAATALAISELS